MSMTYAKLRGRIVEKYRTIGSFAVALDTQIQQVSRKLNGDVGFSRKDIITWCDLLEIKLEEIGVYFFTD